MPAYFKDKVQEFSIPGDGTGSGRKNYLDFTFR